MYSRGSVHKTRMHSSRMRTARLLTSSRSIPRGVRGRGRGWQWGMHGRGVCVTGGCAWGTHDIRGCVACPPPFEQNDIQV